MIQIQISTTLSRSETTTNTMIHLHICVRIMALAGKLRIGCAISDYISFEMKKQISAVLARLRNQVM